MKQIRNEIMKNEAYLWFYTHQGGAHKQLSKTLLEVILVICFQCEAQAPFGTKASVLSLSYLQM